MEKLERRWRNLDSLGDVADRRGSRDWRIWNNWKKLKIEGGGREDGDIYIRDFVCV